METTYRRDFWVKKIQLDKLSAEDKVTLKPQSPTTSMGQVIRRRQGYTKASNSYNIIMAPDMLN